MVEQADLFHWYGERAIYGISSNDALFFRTMKNSRTLKRILRTDSRDQITLSTQSSSLDEEENLTEVQKITVFNTRSHKSW